MTGLPRYAARSIDAPSSEVPVMAGAGCPRFACGEAAEPPQAATSSRRARLTMEMGLRIVRVIWLAYRAVTVPVMLGCTVRTNVAWPAAKAGTS